MLIRTGNPPEGKRRCSKLYLLWQTFLLLFMQKGIGLGRTTGYQKQQKKNRHKFQPEKIATQGHLCVTERVNGNTFVKPRRSVISKTMKIKMTAPTSLEPALLHQFLGELIWLERIR